MSTLSGSHGVPEGLPCPLTLGILGWEEAGESLASDWALGSFQELCVQLPLLPSLETWKMHGFPQGLWGWLLGDPVQAALQALNHVHPSYCTSLERCVPH